jgi:secondary thiamine-phosphate synthase enzyme
MQSIRLETSRRGELIDITGELKRLVASANFEDGLALVYCPHTTAGLTINEGADPAVQADLLAWLDSLAPWENNYRHAEGNSAAHFKASLMGASATVVVEKGQLILGQWQRLFFCEFDGPRTRTLMVKLMAGH